MKLRRLVSGFAALSSGYVVGKGIGFGALLLLARHLPADQLGVYATIVTLIAFLQAMSNWGSDAIGIRAAAQEPDTLVAVYARVVQCRLIMGALPVLALLGGLLWHQSSLLSVAAVSAAWLAFVLRADWALLGRGEHRTVGLWVAVREFVFAGVVFLVVRATGRLETALWAYAIAEWSWTLGTIGSGIGKFRSAMSGSRASFRAMVGQGFPLAIVSVTVLASYKIDVPILAYYRSPEEVSAYWCAYNILFAALLLAGLWSRVGLPAMSHSAAGAAEGGQGASLHYAVLGGVLGIGIAMLLYGAAGPLLHAAYGGRFDVATDALATLALALPASYLSGTLAARLVAESRQRGWSVAAVLSAMLNVGMNVVLIPKYGLMGAAIATVSSEWLCLVVLLCWFREAPVFRAFVGSVGYLILGTSLCVLLIGAFGGQARLWMTVLVTGGFLVYSLPVVVQRVPTAIRLRGPLWSLEA
jgi:O-antigen/teichoic acid export membrane protein